MTVKQLSALLNTLPFEVTFVDEQGKTGTLMKGIRCLSVRPWPLEERFIPAILPRSKNGKKDHRRI